jgi:hypothetical protein
MHHRLDWLHRVEDTTLSPHDHRPVRKGEIFVRTLSDGRLHEGFSAALELVKAVPLYWLVLPFLVLPGVRARIDLEVRGGHGACAVS